MDFMMTEERFEQTDKNQHMRGLLHSIKQLLTGRQDVSSLQPFDRAQTCRTI